MDMIIQHLSAGRWTIHPSGSASSLVSDDERFDGEFPRGIDQVAKKFFEDGNYPVPERVDFCPNRNQGNYPRYDFVSVEFPKLHGTSRRRRAGMEAFAELLRAA
jgi:hypothetical protein